MSDLMLDKHGDFDEERYMKEYNFQLESTNKKQRCETCKCIGKHLNQKEKEYLNYLEVEHRILFVKCLVASKLSGKPIFTPIGSCCKLYKVGKNER